MTAPPSGNDSHDERTGHVHRLVHDFLEQQMQGTCVSEEQIISRHPELMPELGNALRKARIVGDAAQRSLEDRWLRALERMDADKTCEWANKQNPSDSTDESSAASSTADSAFRQLEAIGRYRVVELMDIGGQAVIYRALHPTLPGKELVIKLSRWPVTHPDRIRDRLAEEGNILAELDHPNVARVYDLGLHNNRVFLALEYIRGRTLDQHVESQPLDPREAASLVAQVGRGVAHAHTRGVVHQDIKPRNIVIDEHGRPRLIDFGLASLRYASGREPIEPGSVSGTAPYMAPEQARGVSDQRSDVFSMGAVLYALLVGHPPFDAPTPAESLERARRCDFDREALNARRVPRSLRRICLRAMDAVPARRYATGDELADDLAHFARGPRRTWTIATLLVMLLVLGGALCCWWINPWAPPPQRGVVEQPSPEKPLSGKITVFVWDQADDTRRGVSVQSAGALPLKAEDQIRLSVELSRPAYVYLVWIDTVGSAYPLYPWLDGDWQNRLTNETPVMRLGLPSPGDEGWPIDGPAGMETVMLLVRETPLPPTAQLNTLFTDLPPQHAERARTLLSFEQGEIVAVVASQDRRPKFSDPRPLDDSVLHTQRVLTERLRPHFLLIRAISLYNHGE